MDDNLQISKLKVKNLQEWAQFLMLEIKRFTSFVCRYYVFLCKKSLSDAECKICKYKSLIISAYSSNYMGQILCRGTEEGRKIYKNLQMKLPSKIKYTNICKDVFPVLCIFTFVNTDFCTFLYSL